METIRGGGYTNGREGKGPGIGLSIAHDIVEAHKDLILPVSSAIEGATFTMGL